MRFGVVFTLKPPVTLRPRTKWPVVPELAEDLATLFREAESTDPGAPSRLHARFLLVLSRFFALLKWPYSQPDELRLHERPLADIVEQFLRDNLSQPLSLDDVALVVYTSVPTLIRRYRQETGQAAVKF